MTIAAKPSLGGLVGEPAAGWPRRLKLGRTADGEAADLFAP